jgi:hypothetical protein
MHLIARSKGSRVSFSNSRFCHFNLVDPVIQYISKLSQNRAKEGETHIEEITDVRNGLYMTANLQQVFGRQLIAILHVCVFMVYNV